MYEKGIKNKKKIMLQVILLNRINDFLEMFRRKHNAASYDLLLFPGLKNWIITLFHKTLSKKIFYSHPPILELINSFASESEAGKQYDILV